MKELQALAERAKTYKNINEFVADSIFATSLNGQELEALSAFSGEFTADKLEDFYNQIGGV